MEVLTLLKANIKKKKGTFISIVILMIIIATSMTAILSVRDNYDKGMEQAFEISDSGDILVGIGKSVLTDALRKSVEDSELVKRVKYNDALVCDGGCSSGDVSVGNSQYLTKLRDGIFLYNEDITDFEKEIPQLESGEIYITMGFQTSLECEKGDSIRFNFPDGSYEFTIKGIVQEPTTGSANIGWKQVFISDDDYERILASCKAADSKYDELFLMSIYQSESCSLSDAKFQRQLNLDTKIIAKADISLTKAQSIRYTGLLFDIVSNIMMVFVGMLFVILLIVMSHSISTEIEMDYVSFGILKACGFTKKRLRLIIVAQYLIAELTGIIIGSFMALPLERALSHILISSTAVLPASGLSVGKSFLMALIIIAFSAVIIIIKTKKISSISPVRAISGGKDEIYFDSRFRIPVCKRGLSASLAFRQFILNKRKYFGTIMVVTILTFFLLSAGLIGNVLNSRKSLEAMGMEVTDIDIRSDKGFDDKTMSDIEAIVEQYSQIEKKYYENSGYMSVDGENLRYDCYKYPEYIHSMYNGRVPLYDNEIVISDMIADTLELKIGDAVMLTNGEHEEEFIISGLYQTGNDSGMNFAMSFEGAKKLGVEIIPFMGICIADTSKREDIVSAIEKKYGDEYIVRAYDVEKEGIGGDVDTIVAAMKKVIYIFSILFLFVVVRMVCVKTFLDERRDIGIYKAMGFSSNKLRLQFSFRFLIMSFIGVVIGVVLSQAFSEMLFGMILKTIGLSKVSFDVTFVTLLVPSAVVCVCCFVFSYLAAHKVKSVAVRELVIE